MKPFVPAFSCTLVCVACLNLEQPTPTTTSRLVIHAVLQPHSAVIILVNRSRNGLQSTTARGIGDDEPVTGALVTVSFPTGEIRTAQEGLLCACPGQYGLPVSDNDVLPGAAFTLHVHTTSGEDAAGTTSIPSAPLRPIVDGPRVFLRMSDTLRLRWAPVLGASSYEVVVSSFGSITYRAFADTTVVIPGTALTIGGDLILPPSGRLRVTVAAVDKNYYEYYRAQSDPFAGAPPSHLLGAVGVFGSIAPIIIETLDVR